MQKVENNINRLGCFTGGLHVGYWPYPDPLVSAGDGLRRGGTGRGRGGPLRKEGGRRVPIRGSRDLSDSATLTREHLRAHPAFDGVAVRAAAKLVATYSGNRLLNRVLNDRGRLLFCFLALYLDALPEAEGGGLTVSRMVRLCQETGVCSRGRTKAMMALMRWGGYLEAAEGGSDRRVKPLVPTPHMRAEFRARWRQHFEFLAPLDPVAGRALARLDEAEFFARLAIALVEGFRGGFRVLRFAPDFSPSAERDGGALVLIALFAAARSADGAPSIADLSRRFHISRAQVLQILKEAETDGLVRRDGVTTAGALTPRGEDAILDFFATFLAYFLHAGRQALRAG